MATKRSIVLQGNPRYNEEGVAGAAITPGLLVKGVGTIAVQSGNGTKVPLNVAVEREEIGDDIDVDYASGDTVKVASCYPGCVVLLWVASGQDITADDLLESVGDGYVEEVGSGVPIARALETLGAVTVATRLRAEVI